MGGIHEKEACSARLFGNSLVLGMLYSIRTVNYKKKLEKHLILEKEKFIAREYEFVDLVTSQDGISS